MRCIPVYLELSPRIASTFPSRPSRRPTPKPLSAQAAKNSNQIPAYPDFNNSKCKDLDIKNADQWSPSTRKTVTGEVVQKFLASSTPPENKSRSRKPATIADQHRETGKQAEVVAHLLKGNFDEAFLSSYSASTLNWSIKTLGKKGRLDLSEQLYHWMRLKGIANEHSFVKLCEACEAVKAPNRAILAWRNTSRLPNKSFDLGEHSAAALLKVFRSTVDLENALRILKELETRNSPLNQYAYNIVIRIAADRGDHQVAMKVFQMLRAHPTARPDARTFSALLTAVIAAERWPLISQVNKLIVESAVSPDGKLLLQLMAGYAGAGRPEAAEAVLDFLSDSGMRPWRAHWNTLLMAYAQAQRYEGCLQTYKRMTEGAGMTPDGFTMVALLQGALGARGGLTAASWVLSLMQKYGIPLNIQVGTALISCCRDAPVSEGQRAVEFAKGVLNMMTSSGITPNIRTFNSLLKVQADAGDYNGLKRTLDILESTGNVDPNEATWNIALRAFEEAGYFDKVEEIEALRDTWRMLHGKSL